MKSFTIAKEKKMNLLEYLLLYLTDSECNRMVGVREAYKRHIKFGTVLVYLKRKSEVYYKRIVNEDMTTRPIALQTIEWVKQHNKIMIYRYIKKLLGDIMGNNYTIQFSSKWIGETA